jgi:hypothetical protein
MSTSRTAQRLAAVLFLLAGLLLLKKPVFGENTPLVNPHPAVETITSSRRPAPPSSFTLAKTNPR